MKKFNVFFVILTVFLLVVVIASIKELRLVGDSLGQGKWYFLVLAGFFQFSVFAFQSEVRRSLYRILEIKEKFWGMLAMTFSAMFIGTVIPSFHMASLGLFMNEAKVKGYSHSKALVASITFLFFDTLGFFAALIFALSLLFRLGNLNRYQLISSGILFAIVLGGVIFALLALRKEESTRRLLFKIRKLLPKKQRTKWLPESEIVVMAKETTEAKSYYLAKPQKLWKPILFAILTQVAGALTLMSCFLAFGLPFKFTTVVIVYAMTILFQIVAVTPYGLGSAEFFLTLILANFGINLTQSLLLILVFRFFTFWMPMLAGYFLIRKTAPIDREKLKKSFTKQKST